MDIETAYARVAELVDAHDSKSCSARSVGSIPSTGTSLRSRSERRRTERNIQIFRLGRKNGRAAVLFPVMIVSASTETLMSKPTMTLTLAAAALAAGLCCDMTAAKASYDNAPWCLVRG